MFAYVCTYVCSICVYICIVYTLHMMKAVGSESGVCVSVCVHVYVHQVFAFSFEQALSSSGSLINEFNILIAYVLFIIVRK